MVSIVSIRKFDFLAEKEVDIPQYDFSLFGWHYTSLIKNVVKMAGLEGNERILDFGCGHQELRAYLPKSCTYIAYDIIPEFSDVTEFRNLKNIDVVFCNAVLEHLNKNDLRNLLQDFKKMKIKKLAVWFPNDNTLQRFLEFLFDADASHRFEHYQKARGITNALVDAFGIPAKIKRFHLIAYLAVFEIGSE